MSLKFKIFSVSSVVFLIALPALCATAVPAKSSQRYENLELFQKVLHFVETNYVDEVKNKDLILGAIKGMLETLDPHSNFLPPEMFKSMKNETSGQFGGVGLEIGVKNNVLTVISPMEDTPAWKAGLKAGDRILKINGEITRGMTLTDAVNRMQGKKGSVVTLSVFRKGFTRAKDIKVTRDLIKIVSVKSELLEPGYGYVRLAAFSETAAKDIEKAIGKLEAKQKLKGLILDLRMNPGGLLEQAVDVSSLFVDEGVIVSTIGRNRDQKEIKYARKGHARKDIALAVLVNSSSASAAEIVAGALQDHHRAIIMGQPTFGKGSVQSVIDLGNELGLKLTIARYFTPSGRSIQERGVQPDIILDDLDPKILAEARKKSEADVFREKDLRNHMTNTDKTADESAESEGALPKDYSDEDLENLVNEDAEKNSSKSPAKKEVLAKPERLNPKEDYQVREAKNYLKSFEIFKKISMTNGKGPST